MVRDCLSRLYIGNLPADATEDSLRDYLLTGGKVPRNSFSITMKKGYAFMQCGDQATADVVIDLFHGADYGGNIICIEPAVSNFAGANTKRGRCMVTLSRVSDEENRNETVASIQDLEKILCVWGGTVLSLEKFSSCSFIVVVTDKHAGADLISALNGITYDGLKVKAVTSPEFLKSNAGFSGSGDASSSMRRKSDEQTELPSSSTGDRDLSPGEGYRPRFSGPRSSLYVRGLGPPNTYRGRGNSRWNYNYNPSAQFPWRMLVPASQVGALIGRSGATIRAITQSNSVRINIHTGHNYSRNLPDAEKVLSIVGSPANITAACREILQVLAQDLSKTFGAELSLRLMAFDSLIGRVIGKGGSNITKVMLESNTRIHISNMQDTPRSIQKSGDCDRIITIRGSIGGMSQAEGLVSVKLRSSYDSDMYQPPKGQFAPSGYFQYQQH